ncbi:MAG: type VI secretion system tip protein VgrG [Amoebophilaceae bacterium]|nr:type VI secretion system tip protein VgrG [Amoebophilaceae bacterium]
MSVPNNFIKYSIKVGSKVLKEHFPIQSIMVDKRINKIPYAKIVLYDGDIAAQSFFTANDKTFKIGADVTIEAGYGTDLAKIFQGVIAKLAVKSRSSGASTFVVTCRDIAYKTTLGPKTMHFQQCKDSDIFKKILDQYKGLTSNLEATTTVHESISQYEVSDWDFLNIRAEANGLVIVVNDGKVSIKQPKSSGKGAFSYTYGVDFIDFDAEIDVKDQWQGANAFSWNVGKQQLDVAKAADPGERSMGDISYKELLGGQKAVPIAHGGIDNAEVKNLASGLLERARIAKVKGSITVLGNPKLLHGKSITIEKGAAHFAGNAYISGVRHLISAGTYYTELTMGLDAQRYMHKYTDIIPLAAAGMMPPIHGLQIGIVKQITADPKKSDRIFVHLPLIQQQAKAGIWCRLASFYASNQAGAFFIPEVNDEVIVGFINDDVRAPIILGSLYSQTHGSPNKMDEKNNLKSFVSRAKLKLTFNDDPKAPEMSMQTPKGSIIKITDEKEAGIHIEDIHGNKIILNSKGIGIISRKDIRLNAGGSIKLNSLDDCVVRANKNVNISGMNVNTKASMKASLEGNASTEVKSGMVTIVKGTTVLIN